MATKKKYLFRQQYHFLPPLSLVEHNYSFQRFQPTFLLCALHVCVLLLKANRAHRGVPVQNVSDDSSNLIARQVFIESFDM